VLLQATRSLPRIRFTGGAGSGKTWLAVEKARLLSRQGKRVGLFCYNKGLGQYLQDRVRLAPGKARVHGRVPRIRPGAGRSRRFGAGVLRRRDAPPAEGTGSNGMEPHERLDAVVVDEAQDFAPLWWDALLACTKTPTAVKCMPSWTTARTSTAVGRGDGGLHLRPDGKLCAHPH
jgi:hypothetical protein